MLWLSLAIMLGKSNQIWSRRCSCFRARPSVHVAEEGTDVRLLWFTCIALRSCSFTGIYNQMYFWTLFGLELEKLLASEKNTWWNIAASGNIGFERDRLKQVRLLALRESFCPFPHDLRSCPLFTKPKKHILYLQEMQSLHWLRLQLKKWPWSSLAAI